MPLKYSISRVFLSLHFKNKTSHDSFTEASVLPFLYCGILELDNLELEFLFFKDIKIDTVKVLSPFAYPISLCIIPSDKSNIMIIINSMQLHDCPP